MIPHTEEIPTIMDIKKSSTVEGRQGPQWELTVTWPWTVGQNIDQVWLEKADYPEELGARRYKVLVKHRGLKNKQTGGKHNGSLPWMWNWTLVRFLNDDVEYATLQGQRATPGTKDGLVDHAPAAPPPAATQRPGKDIAATGPETPQPVPQALGACQNHAMAFIESGIMPVPEGRDPISWLWELRDLIYRGVNQSPYHPGGFCYVHETLFDHTEKGERAAKYHIVEGGYCVEGQGFIAKEA